MIDYFKTFFKDKIIDGSLRSGARMYEGLRDTPRVVRGAIADGWGNFGLDNPFSYTKTSGLAAGLTSNAASKAYDGASELFTKKGMINFFEENRGRMFKGAALGLGISAVGLGLSKVFPNNVQSDGAIESTLKGAIVGGAAAVGISAFSSYRSEINSGMMNNMLNIAEKDGNIGARAIAGLTRLSAGRLAALGVAGGAAYQLTKSIISTNFTKPIDR